jgi:hypothetical protein
MVKRVETESDGAGKRLAEVERTAAAAGVSCRAAVEVQMAQLGNRVTTEVRERSQAASQQLASQLELEVLPAVREIDRAIERFRLGLGRIAALHHRSSTLYQIH